MKTHHGTLALYGFYKAEALRWKIMGINMVSVKIYGLCQDLLNHMENNIKRKCIFQLHIGTDPIPKLKLDPFPLSLH